MKRSTRLVIIMVAVANFSGMRLSAEEVKHAKIEATQIINDDLLKKIPKDGEFFRNFLKAAAKNFYIGIAIPEYKAPDGHRFDAWPDVQTPGITETRWTDGHFYKVHVVVVWPAVTSNYSSTNEAAYWGAHHGAGRIIQMLLTVSYVMPQQTAVMVVPFEVTVWRDNNWQYAYKDLKVDLTRVAVSTTSEPAATAHGASPRR